MSVHDLIQNDDDTFETVDLDSMTTEELLRERADVKAEIGRLTLKVMDPSEKPDGEEDGSPPWRSYRAWRHQVRRALIHREEELDHIKVILAERNAQRAAEKQILKATLTAQFMDRRAASQERRVEILSTLDGTPGVEALLLRCKRLISTLMPAGTEDYDERFELLDAMDQDTHRLLHAYLYAKYSRDAIKAFLRGELAESRP